jgi:hypothetical protein
MEKAYNFLVMEIGTRDITRMENLKEKEHILGTTDLFIKVILKTDFDLVMECGNMEHRNIRAPTSMIRETDKGHILGEEAAIIKDSLFKI